LRLRRAVVGREAVIEVAEHFRLVEREVLPISVSIGPSVERRVFQIRDLTKEMRVVGHVEQRAEGEMPLILGFSMFAVLDQYGMAAIDA